MKSKPLLLPQNQVHRSVLSARDERFAIDKQRRKAQKQLAKAGCIIPTLAELEKHQKSAVRLSDKLGIDIDDCWRDPGRSKCYEVDTFKCPGSCPRASTFAKLDHLPRATELIEKYEGPHLFVTLAHPKWRYPFGSLEDFDVSKAVADFRRWLRAPGLDDIRGVAGFEVSLDRNLDGSRWWQGNCHLIVAGASKPDLQAALAVGKRYDLKRYAHPLQIVPANGVMKRLGYALKGGAEVRVERIYEGKKFRGKDHMSADERDEHQRWVSASKVDELLTFVGMRRYGGTLHLIGKNSPKSRK